MSEPKINNNIDAQSERKKVVIIGAGPAGISCGYRLAQNGHKVEIHEASGFVGGMARSFDLWEQRVDLGPHRFFTKNEEVNLFFDEVLDGNYTFVDRKTRIRFNNSFFDYPLKISNVLSNVSVISLIQILFSYMMVRLQPKRNAKNFEEWVTNQFGKKLFEIFFKNYTEKLWGIPCTEIDADWAAQRIKTLSLKGAIVAAIIGDRKNNHVTLVEKFKYPCNGTGTIYERATETIRKNHGKVTLNSPVKGLLFSDLSNKVTGVELTDGSKVEADFVVSTMPLTLLVKSMKNINDEVANAVNSLYFRNTILVYLEIDTSDLFSDNWIYVHSPDVKHGRITNFRNWCPSLNNGKKSTILCMEYWCFDEDEIWSTDEEHVIELSKKEIRSTKLIPKENNIIRAKVVKIPKCYPVYETGYRDKINKIKNHINSIDGLLPIGRYGSFKYNNQDHSIFMGLVAADKISNKTNMDLWNINTDSHYQEKGELKV